MERRHFKLWLNSAEVFERIIGSGEWQRNEALIRNIQERVAVYVDSPQYAEALNILERERVVIISGAPGVGKSTIAEMLILSYWESGWKLVNLHSNVTDAWRHVHEHGNERVIFYYDDFLGQTSGLELQKNENSDLDLLIKTLRRSKSGNALLVMTTRSQILKQALNGPDDRVRQVLQGRNPIRIELSEISRNARARMLFNHLYFVYRESETLRHFAYDRRYLDVIDHPGFNPRLLQSVIIVNQPDSVDSLYEGLAEAMEHPETLWLGSFKQLSSFAVRILLNLAIEPRRLVTQNDLLNIPAQSDPRSFRDALKVLDETWIRIEVGGRIRLFDPSRRDFLLDQLEDPQMFKTALEDAYSIWQIEHLVKYKVRPEIKAYVDRFSSTIEKRAIELYELTEEKDFEHFTDIHAVRALASILQQVPSLTSLKELIRSALHLLDKENDGYISITREAPSLFDLASELEKISGGWAKELAERCAVYGLEFITDTDDLENFADLPEQLRSRIAYDSTRDVVYQILNDELDNIGQQDDRSRMEERLQDLEALAWKLDEFIDLDSVQEIIAETPERPNYHRPHRVTRMSADGGGLENSDDAIVELFARLGS